MNSIIKFFNKNYFYILPILVSFSLYALLFGIYQVDNIDNPWNSAWIYNFFNRHITHDTVFFEGESNYWGVRLFSHIYCYLYGAILSIMGFSLHKIQFISHLLIILGLVCWYSVAKLLLKDIKHAFMFVILLALSGAVMNSANEARSDALVFFLIGLSFLLWIRQRHFFSLLFTSMAIETHPIGGIALFYIFAYFIYYEKTLILNPKFLLNCIAGVASGIFIYLFFHYSEIQNLSSILGRAHDHDNFILDNFYRLNKGVRHLKNQEVLITFLLAAIIYLINYKKKDLYFLISGICVCLSSLVFTHSNYHYTLFTYPALWLLTIYAFSGLNNKFFKLEYLFIFILILDVSQYLHRAKNHKRVRQFNQYIAQVQSLDLPKDSQIYSGYIDYFAFYEYPGFHYFSSQKIYNHFYFLEHIGTIFTNNTYNLDLSKWKHKKIKTLLLKSGGIINVYQVERS